MLLLGFILLHCSAAFAHHPNEGSLALDTIIQEALSQNQEIKAAEARFNSVKANSAKSKAAYFPELSLEGGPLRTKYDSEKHSGTAAYAKAEWNLFRGGKDSALISKANIEAKRAEAHLQFTKAKIARDSAKIYYEMLFILESLDLKQKAIDMNRDQMKLAKSKKSSGFTSEADVIEFELREATLSSDLKQLQQAQAAKSRELALLIGREGDSSLSVLGHLARQNLSLKKEKLLALVDERNQEILDANAELDSAKKDLWAAKADFLPTIDLAAKYGKLANEEKVFTDKNSYSVGLTVNIPIFSGLSTFNGLKASQFESERAEIQSTKEQRRARAEAERLLSALSSLNERLELEEKTLPRSEEYYKITTAEYRRGVKNSPDMVTASERLMEARIRNLEFRKEYQITVLEILSLAGLAPNEQKAL